MKGTERDLGRCLLGGVTAVWLLLVFVWPQSGMAQERRPELARRIERARAGEAEYVEGRVIVKYRMGVSEVARAALRAETGARTLRRLDLIDAEVLQLAEGVAVREAVDWYSAWPEVEYAEPDFLVYAIEGQQPAQVIPDDPMFGDLWGMNNTGQTGGTPDADIDAPEGWEAGTDASTIIVGDIDTGVDYTHEDLVANMWTNPGEIPDDGIDNDGNGYTDDVHGWDFCNDDNDPFDDHNHGTHVAGTIGAVGNNGIGVAGVAWRVQIMALKFISAAGSGSSSDAILAVEYAVSNGARLTSNSWGCFGSDCFSQALSDAIQASGEAGLLFVAAAGNDYSDIDITPFYPAGYDLDNIISVAATDHNDAKAAFSNWGATTVDLGAPGVNILSTVPGDGYEGGWNGTSMATPHVAGAAALVHAQFPSLTHLDVRNRILASGDPVASLDGITVTGKRLNLASALEDDLTPPNAVTDLAVVADPEGAIGPMGLFSLTLEWTATGDDGDVGNAGSYDLRYSTAPIDDGNFGDAAQVSGEPVPGPPGATESHTVTGLDFGTTYYFALKVSDNVGNASPLSNVVEGATDAAQVIFFDDAESPESDEKWTADPPWARTTEDASPDGEPGVAGGILSWTDSPGGEYGNNIDVSLTSVPFSLAEARGTFLIFDHKYDIESGYDYGYLGISTDGATWTNLATYTGSEANWVTESFDLSDYDGEPSVQIRFRLTSDNTVTRDGWYVDDVGMMSEMLTELIVTHAGSPLGEPAILAIELENEDEVAGVDYQLVFDDPFGLVEYVGAQLTDRTTDFTLDSEFDGANTITTILYGEGGATIAAGTGAITEHTFNTSVPGDIADLPVTAVEVDAPEDPNTGVPQIFFPVVVTLADFAVSDVLGNELPTTGHSGSLRLGLLNTDVDFSSQVDVADIVSLVDFFLDRIGFTDMQFLVADAHMNDEIDVVDVVRGVNIILGRPIGRAAPELVAFNVADAGDPRDRGAFASRVDFSLEPSFGLAMEESPWFDLVAEIPDDVVGLQITVRYDPSRVTLLGESLALDDRHYRLAAKHGAGYATFMIFSLSNRVLEPGTRALVRLRAERTDLEAAGAPIANELEFIRAVAVDAAGQVIQTNVSMPLSDEGPSAFSLGLNYPNPFTTATGTRIELTVPTSDVRTQRDPRVTVRIYSLRGTLVRTLVDRPLPGGRYTYSWDGTNDRGAVVNSGIYVLVMQAEGFVERRRIVFIR